MIKPLILKRKTLFEKKWHRYDLWESDDSDGYELYLKIEKIYTLKGVYYKVSCPNYVCHDRHLYNLFADVFSFMDTKSPGYFRLEDHLRKRGVWKTL